MTTTSIILALVLALLFAGAAGYAISAWRSGGRWLLLTGGLVALFVTFVLVSTLTTLAITAWLP